ncbi:DUF2798 domain-containing protein [Denitrobaculum tricleocarpae]|uniref:DUF2798 domain-containing protein n=1 Tax=Denitrobaculum tricleocarpae TaxID=2591009 RepID=A0A545TB66_9PROT|nr:DUF2798 domain-containing protein [Denitrobaculum tricleocarpae]TQV74452.1 DUF2798 domain-containing protein [Denitrobaculum tricleocarpae]
MKQRLLSAALMSFALSLLMTCWVTWINLGWNPDFIRQWLSAFLLAWPAAAVIAFAIGPAVQKLSLTLLSPTIKKQETRPL